MALAVTENYYNDSLSYFKNIGMADDFEERMAQMEKDRAIREEEWGRDMMQYERAGLSEAEKAKIPKLDADNNASYSYLRSKGNMWEYDPTETHNKLKNRLYRRFDTYPKISDRQMFVSEVSNWADRFRPISQANDAQIEKLRAVMRTFFENCGVTETGIHRENWIEAQQCFAEAERERMKHGEHLQAFLLGNACYDVLDGDENTFVSMPELKKMMHVFHVPGAAAYTFFEMADVKGEGKLQRKEVHELFHRFWWPEVFNPDLDGIFAYKF